MTCDTFRCCPMALSSSRVRFSFRQRRKGRRKKKSIFKSKRFARFSSPIESFRQQTKPERDVHWREVPVQERFPATCPIATDRQRVEENGR